MAEASNKKVNLSVNQDENFCVFNVLCVFISLVTILADLTTGKVKLFLEMWTNEKFRLIIIIV